MFENENQFMLVLGFGMFCFFLLAALGYMIYGFYELKPNKILDTVLDTIATIIFAIAVCCFIRILWAGCSYLIYTLK